MKLTLTKQETAMLLSALDRRAEDFEKYTAEEMKALGIFEYVATIESIAKKLGVTYPLTNAIA